METTIDFLSEVAYNITEQKIHLRSFFLISHPHPFVFLSYYHLYSSISRFYLGLICV